MGRSCYIPPISCHFLLWRQSSPPSSFSTKKTIGWEFYNLVLSWFFLRRVQCILPAPVIRPHSSRAHTHTHSHQVLIFFFVLLWKALSYSLTLSLSSPWLSEAFAALSSTSLDCWLGFLPEASVCVRVCVWLRHGSLRAGRLSSVLVCTTSPPNLAVTQSSPHLITQIPSHWLGKDDRQETERKKGKKKKKRAVEWWREECEEIKVSVMRKKTERASSWGMSLCFSSISRALCCPKPHSPSHSSTSPSICHSNTLPYLHRPEQNCKMTLNWSNIKSLSKLAVVCVYLCVCGLH